MDVRARIEVRQGDITRLAVDAIVNAANSSLLGGGGVAFPSISTGIYGYPLDAAAEVAVATVAGVLEASSLAPRVIFCTFTADATLAIESALAALDL